MHIFIQYLIVASATIGIDLLWLGVIAKSWYTSHMHKYLTFIDGSLMVRWPAALSCWALLTIGVRLFVTPLSPSFLSAAQNGFLFGLIVYGVYDLTNYALLADWSITLAVGDVLWGGVICSLIAVMWHAIGMRL